MANRSEDNEGFRRNLVADRKESGPIPNGAEDAGTRVSSISILPSLLLAPPPLSIDRYPRDNGNLLSLPEQRFWTSESAQPCMSFRAVYGRDLLSSRLQLSK